MKSIIDSIKGYLTEGAISKIASKVGLDEAKTNKLIEGALPMVVEGLNRNTNDEAGAASLNSALDKHDGSILDDLMGNLDNPGMMQDGSKIVSHIFGDKENEIINNLGKASESEPGTVNSVLSALGPIVMAQLGKEKQVSGLDASSLSGLLTQESKEKGLTDNPLVKGFLDKDGDGSVMDDMLDMAKGFFK